MAACGQKCKTCPKLAPYGKDGGSRLENEEKLGVNFTWNMSPMTKTMATQDTISAWF